jgi:hypothetical protein
MKRFDFKLHTILLLLIVVKSSSLFAQESTLSLTQDAKFEKMLNEKRRINSSILSSDNYKIQIFNGDNESAKKTLNQFKKDFTNFDSTIIFSTPTYKVLIGNFKTRIEAERNLIEIKKTYKTALLIRPFK